METITLRTPEILNMDGHLGFNQEWYTTSWQRKAGCGPTACATLLWYLARTRTECAQLADGYRVNRDGALALMESAWEYVTPGMMGVNTTGIFSDGVQGLGEAAGLHLNCRILQIPARRSGRDIQKVLAFIRDCLADDLPVAFLNLSNGEEKRLESWHWVTLISLAPASGEALIYDDGHALEIDLPLWIRTSAMGGGFVALEPAE